MTIEHTVKPGRLEPELRTRIRELLVQLRGLPEHVAERDAVRDRLVELNTPLVRYLVQRFRDTKEPLEDLVQVGMIGLLKAIERYDPDRGLEFSTYAVPTILGEIKRYFRDSSWAVHVPRGARDLHSAILASRAQLSQQLGRSLTVADVADRVGASEQDVIMALEAGQAYTSGSLDAMAEAMGEARDAAFGFLDPGLEQAELRADLRPAIATLPRQQREILVLRFVHGQSQTQIAAALGVSQMQVSRLLARALRQLRETLTTPRGGVAGRALVSVGSQPAQSTVN
ncbi:MAG: SigB/SigF/SigG family RNA polymerase sigma factor [Jatrophihabitantaceae bacterium]